ncbi:MAG: hypothetical protein ABI462_06345 [Ignavibacteria bacterium]
MMKVFMKNKSKFLRSFIVLILISGALTGSDCEKSLVNNGSVPSEMVGTWILVEQTGALQDICAEENADLQSSGVALLTCPGGSTISRDFTVSNNVLTYTQSSVAYEYEFTNENQNLTLYGQNVSRNLKYERSVTDQRPSGGKENAGFNNSSELRR